MNLKLKCNTKNNWSNTYLLRIQSINTNINAYR